MTHTARRFRLFAGHAGYGHDRRRAGTEPATPFLTVEEGLYGIVDVLERGGLIWGQKCRHSVNMTRRTGKFKAAVEALGSIVIGPSNPNDGWPGQVTIATSIGNVQVALHISAISSHARRPYEKRFQNPASNDRPPVSDLRGTAIPILLGTDHDSNPSVFVAVDGRSRVGNANRFSLLFHERIIEEAKRDGWAVYESTTREKIYAFMPALFPAFIEQILAGEMLSKELITETAIAAGVFDHPKDEEATTEAAKRATKAVNILARKAGAGKRIRSAYNHRCAMCGIGSNLLAGAHIFPVEAPGSTDEVWNGLSLCHNHHSAFDQHLIWVNPATKEIRVHPSLQATAVINSGTRHFVDSTLSALELPEIIANRPRTIMFENRYSYFSGKYDWAG